MRQKVFHCVELKKVFYFSVIRAQGRMDAKRIGLSQSEQFCRYQASPVHPAKMSAS